MTTSNPDNPHVDELLTSITQSLSQLPSEEMDLQPIMNELTQLTEVCIV